MTNSSLVPKIASKQGISFEKLINEIVLSAKIHGF
jgi:D-alanine-D-alanine ligase-like ATP-grasp enzyme